MFVPLRRAVQEFGVHPNTLRKWADDGKIKSIRTPAGQRLFDVASLDSGKDRRRVLYCRVSSAGQRDDLRRQSAELRQRFPDYELVEDTGSGLNWKRKGFVALLDAILSGTVSEVVVAHKDRLCRFGFELLQRVASYHHCRIVVLGDAQLSPEAELVNDLVSIIHVFSCRVYGMRKYARQVSQDSALPHGGKPTKGKATVRAGKVLVQRRSRISKAAGNTRQSRRSPKDSTRRKTS
jgi:predicted site-specific integrase-resolvase